MQPDNIKNRKFYIFHPAFSFSVPIRLSVFRDILKPLNLFFPGPRFRFSPEQQLIRHAILQKMNAADIFKG